MTALVSTRFASTQSQTLRRMARWSDLCDRYLPVVQEGSFWRYHRKQRAEDPWQGWKLHVSATVLNAHRVLERIGPLLASWGVQFKAPTSLVELKRLNSGVDSPYTQIGKVFTVYPDSDAQASVIAREIHKLTRHMTAPAVPFDMRYHSKSNVYYRYGAFTSQEMDLPNGARVSALRDPRGILVPDTYGPGKAFPSWVNNPFPTRRERVKKDSPLRTTFRVFRALSQRGKGGVYQAVDISATPPRLCLVKEGRKTGEIGWDGRDGRWRVKHEQRVLNSLRERGVDVPCVYSSFELEGNYYIVTEFIDGENLLAFLMKRRRRLSVTTALNYGAQLSTFISRIHAAGWIWRDCKPSNLILTKRGVLKSLDFEGSCPIDQPDTMSWTTPSFAPPDARVDSRGSTIVYDDLFALGTIIYLLLTGRMPESSTSPLAIRALRRNVPDDVCELVSELLKPDPKPLLSAQEIADQLTSALSRVKSSNGNLKRPFHNEDGGGSLRRSTREVNRGSSWSEEKIGSTVI